MRILFDQGTPAPLRHQLIGHEVVTAFEMGWAALTNGELLKSAAASFDLLLTTDQNLPYQQNLGKLRLAVLILPTTSWITIQHHVAHIREEIENTQPGAARMMQFSG